MKQKMPQKNHLDTIKYRKDPIIEVVCEFRFIPRSEWEPGIPDLIHERVKETFPRRDILRIVESAIRSEAEGLEQRIQIGERVRLLSSDGAVFIQIGPNLLAINHLKPYPTWEKFLPLIQQGFEAYCQVAEPKGIQRIGLRYINRFNFRSSPTNLKTYFRFRPEYPPPLEKAPFISFRVGTTALYEGERDQLTVHLISAPPEPPHQLAAILDLDYATRGPGAIALDEVVEWLTRTAHVHIQEAFEACLTEELKQEFEPEQES